MLLSLHGMERQFNGIRLIWMGWDEMEHRTVWLWGKKEVDRGGDVDRRAADSKNA